MDNNEDLSLDADSLSHKDSTASIKEEELTDNDTAQSHDKLKANVIFDNCTLISETNIPHYYPRSSLNLDDIISSSQDGDSTSTPHPTIHNPPYTEENHHHQYYEKQNHDNYHTSSPKQSDGDNNDYDDYDDPCDY